MMRKFTTLNVGGAAVSKILHNNRLVVRNRKILSERANFPLIEKRGNNSIIIHEIRSKILEVQQIVKGNLIDGYSPKIDNRILQLKLLRKMQMELN